MYKLDFEKDFKEKKNLNFYIQDYKIGLDIDEVICDFLDGYYKKNLFSTRHPYPATNWTFTYDEAWFNDLKTDETFWTTLKPKILSSEIPFIPTCYISKRSFPIDWTKNWLEHNGFPCVPVIHVESDKVEACKKMELDFFVDDSFYNFQRLNANGVKTFLMNAPHNKQFDVGDYRINELRELIYKI